jgi:hypothetical protein
LEPVARWASGQIFEPAVVWGVEVALAGVAAALFAFTLIAWRRSSERQSMSG